MDWKQTNVLVLGSFHLSSPSSSKQEIGFLRFGGVNYEGKVGKGHVHSQYNLRSSFLSFTLQRNGRSGTMEHDIPSLTITCWEPPCCRDSYIQTRSRIQGDNVGYFSNVILIKIYYANDQRFLRVVVLFLEFNNAIRTSHNFHILITTIVGIGSYFMDMYVYKEHETN